MIETCVDIKFLPTARETPRDPRLQLIRIYLTHYFGNGEYADGNPVTIEGIKERNAKSFFLGAGSVGFPSRQNRAGIIGSDFNFN